MKTVTFKDSAHENCPVYTKDVGSWTSFENDVKHGEMRVIDEKIHYAGAIFSRKPLFRKRVNEVIWYELRERILPKKEVK